MAGQHPSKFTAKKYCKQTTTVAFGEPGNLGLDMEFSKNYLRLDLDLEVIDLRLDLQVIDLA